MSSIKIDKKEYEIDRLSPGARGQQQSLQLVDAQFERLQAQTAVLQTALVSHAKALQQSLVEPSPSFTGDTIKLG